MLLDTLPRPQPLCSRPPAPPPVQSPLRKPLPPTDGQKFPLLFYRTSSPFGSAALPKFSYFKKDGPGPVMVSSTLCPAVHILGSQNVYDRAEGIADHYWPWAVFFKILILLLLLLLLLLLFLTCSVFPAMSLSLRSSWFFSSIFSKYCWFSIFSWLKSTSCRTSPISSFCLICISSFFFITRNVEFFNLEI